MVSRGNSAFPCDMVICCDMALPVPVLLVLDARDSRSTAQYSKQKLGEP